MLGNTHFIKSTEEATIMKDATISPDHTPICIRIRMPEERYIMKHTHAPSDTKRLDKANLRDPEKLRFFTGQMQAITRETLGDVDEEDAKLTSEILDAAAKHIANHQATATCAKGATF